MFKVIFTNSIMKEKYAFIQKKKTKTEIYLVWILTIPPESEDTLITEGRVNKS